jgi:hypothetical protein
MEVQPDFRELLGLFNAHSVEYMIVGGYALAFHGAPRFTGDLDIFVRPTAQNARRILGALEDFGFGSLNLSAEEFSTQDRLVQLGAPPVRVDIITSLTRVSWEQCFAGQQPGTYGDVPVHYIGREQFVVNKRATGRRRDLADLEALGET